MRFNGLYHLLIGHNDKLLLMLMGALVGVCSGVVAVLLNRSLASMFEWGYHYRDYYWSFLIPAAGAALSSLFLEKIVKEGAGHGVPEVVYSVSRYGGLIRLRSSFSRLISSCLTIGSGGSAGPEAPIVISGSSIGSNVARFFKLNERQRITMVGCGAAGAIASIFNAPIAGLVFTIEVILGEWKTINIVPVAMASVAGAEVSRTLQGNQIVFGQRQFEIGLMDIGAGIGLALLTAAASILLTRTLRNMHHVADKISGPLWIKAACGGGAVGIISLFFPVVAGEGYHFIQDIIQGVFSGGIIFAAVCVLAKITATSLTLGWGGSGGIFAPCLVIGSLLGLTYHRILNALGSSASLVEEGCFALLGMAGMISGILQAPLTGIFLIVEISGGYSVILPLIIVSVTSSTICSYAEPASFYFKDLIEKGQLLRPGTDARVLTDLTVTELLEKDCMIVHPNMLLRDFIRIIQQSHRNYFPVIEQTTGYFIGIIHLDDIRQYIFNPDIYDAVLIEQIMDANVETVSPDDDLNAILRRMDAQHLFSMPVVANGKFMGMISKATLLDQYRKELIVQTTA